MHHTNVVKANELINIWLKSCDIALKSVNVLGNMYFLMDGSDLDDLCLWIYNKRTFCCDKEVTIENLLQPSEPKNGIPVPEDNVLRRLEETDENLSDGIHIDAVENEQISQICYIPVCKEWQKDHCNLLGLPYIHGNMEHHTTHVMVTVHLEQPELFLMVIAFFEHFHFHFLVHRTIIKKFAYWLQPTRLITQQILNCPALLMMVKQWILT